MRVLEQIRIRKRELSVLVVIAFNLVIFFPGNINSDTYARWAAAYTLSGHVNDISWALSQWLSPIMTIVMSPIAFLGISTGWFTIAMVVFIAYICLIWVRVDSKSWVWAPITLAMPLVFNYLSYVVPDTITAFALVGTGIALGRFSRDGVTRHTLILAIVSVVPLLTFRSNSLMLTPVLIAAFWLARDIRLVKKLIATAAIAILLVLSSLIPNAVGFQSGTSSSSAMAWELAGINSLAKHEGRVLKAHSTFSGITSTSKAIQQYSPNTIDTLLWPADAALPTGLVIQNEVPIRTNWINAVIENPDLYLKTKLGIWSCAIGFCSNYLTTTVDPFRPEYFINADVVFYKGGNFFGDQIQKINNFVAGKLLFLLLPVFWVPIAALAYWYLGRTKSEEDRWIACLALTYLLSFFVFSQAASFRYMFPAFLVAISFALRALFKFAADLQLSVANWTTRI